MLEFVNSVGGPEPMQLDRFEGGGGEQEEELGEPKCSECGHGHGNGTPGLEKKCPVF